VAAGAAPQGKGWGRTNRPTIDPSSPTAMHRILAATTLAFALGSIAVAQSHAPVEPGVLPIAQRTSRPEFRPAPAADPDGGALRGAIDPLRIHDQLFWSEEGAETWIRGRTYKASAGPDGFAYVPFLGSDAPRTWPVAFRLESARIGGEGLALTEVARKSRRGDRVVLDRGAVEVTYDVALDSVEQSFHLDARGGGPLVLDVAVETDLDAAAEGAGFRFGGPDGGVRYSGAIAFDEAGHRTDVATELAGGTLRLTVPAAFVESAVGRVTVDPILTTYGLRSGTTSRFLETDIAYDQSTAYFLVGVVEVFATNDADVALVAHDVPGNVFATMSGFFSLDDMRGVSIASQNADDVALVVSTRRPSSAGFIGDVVGRIIDFPTGSAGPLLAIADSVDDEYDADVGGNGSTNPNGRFLVVWTRNELGFTPQTEMRGVRTDGTLEPVFLLDPQTTEIQVDPRVSKSVGDPADVNFWTVITQVIPVGGAPASIKAIQVNANAQTALAPAQDLVTFPAGVGAENLDVSTALLLPDPTGTTTSPTYLVSYDELGGDGDVMLVTAQDLTARLTRSLPLIEHAELDREQGVASLAVTRDDYVVAYHEVDPGGATVSTYAATLDVIEGVLIAVNERRLVLQSGADAVASPVGLASRYEAGQTGSSWIGAAWSQDAGGWTVEGARIGVEGRTSIGAQYCYGQPNSTGERGFIAIYGDRGTTTTKTAVGSGMPAQQFCLLGTGTLPAQVNPVPNSQGTLCIAGAVGRFNAQITQIAPDGTATVAIDPQMIPGPTSLVAAMAGETRGFQFWHRDVTTTGAPTSNFTNGAAVTFR